MTPLFFIVIFVFSVTLVYTCCTLAGYVCPLWKAKSKYIVYKDNGSCRWWWVAKRSWLFYVDVDSCGKTPEAAMFDYENNESSVKMSIKEIEEK